MVTWKPVLSYLESITTVFLKELVCCGIKVLRVHVCVGSCIYAYVLLVVLCECDTYSPNVCLLREGLPPTQRVSLHQVHMYILYWLCILYLALQGNDQEYCSMETCID